MPAERSHQPRSAAQRAANARPSTAAASRAPRLPAPSGTALPTRSLEPDDDEGEEQDEGEDEAALEAAPPQGVEPVAAEQREHGAAPLASAPQPPAEPAPPDEATERRERPQPRPRRLELTVLRRWTQPGLCARAEQATEAQRTLMRHFRISELSNSGRVYLDPRLPPGAERPALEHLEEAQRVLREELQLTPGVPDVFLYHDVQLLLASACTNADVVAYYDGALHVVVTRDDVRESVLHEFTHHALMTTGVLGPAWVQEGMAMHIARETWWRRPDLLGRLIERPFGLDTMETMVPYTLESEDAVLFYAQSAAMVECALREPDSSLSDLLSELDVRQSPDALDYGLPALAELSALRSCMRELLQEEPTRE